MAYTITTAQNIQVDIYNANYTPNTLSLNIDILTQPPPNLLKNIHFILGSFIYKDIFNSELFTRMINLNLDFYHEESFRYNQVDILDINLAYHSDYLLTIENAFLLGLLLTLSVEIITRRIHHKNLTTIFNYVSNITQIERINPNRIKFTTNNSFESVRLTEQMTHSFWYLKYYYQEPYPHTFSEIEIMII